MASPLTRSSRAPRGLSTRSSTRNNVVIPNPMISGNNSNSPASAANIGRKKRPRDEIDTTIITTQKKRRRIAIEIAAATAAKKKTRSIVVKKKDAVLIETVTAEKEKCSSTASPPPTKIKAQRVEIETQARVVPPTPPPEPARKHHDKVVNGIKHELDRLQPGTIILDVKDEKRKLRSQEGTRFKSDLSAYFSEYDEIIGNDQKEEHVLNHDTKLLLRKKVKSKTANLPERFDSHTLKDDPEDLFTNLNDCHRIDSSVLIGNVEEAEEDPLDDAYFQAIHRKPERQEKSIRNTDRGRAQHEKDQIIRLLDGLQGHDWLKVMGVSGVTDSRKKVFEPAREYFIRGCKAIVEKFQIWKDEEKRQKLEKEAALVEAEDDEDVDEKVEEVEAVEEVAESVSDGDPPDYSDVDASAARQLHEEAIARSNPVPKHSGRGRPKAVPVHRPLEVEEKPFTSFFSKPYLRTAALGKHRRSGRSVVAFGHPVPEVDQRDFDLPKEYRDEDTLKSHARKKRRMRRVSKA